MEKTDKPLTRDALVSMQVIDSKGHSVGKVKDVCFQVGKYGISLAVESEDGDLRTVEWDDVQAASDFVILKSVSQSIQSKQKQPVLASSLTEEEKVFGKEATHQQNAQTAEPVQTPAKKKSTQPVCPTCNKPLKWIPQYKRWYCYNDKKYV